MVATLDAAHVQSDAVRLFQESAIPPGWEWIESLSPLNARLFAVELADGIKETVISGNVEALVTLVAEWQATAELDAAPEVLAEMQRPLRHDGPWPSLSVPDAPAAATARSPRRVAPDVLDVHGPGSLID